jgi:uncharacterized membrane protein
MRKLRISWNRVRSNYWFVPTVIIALGFGLAYGMLTLDALLPTKYVLHLSWIYTRGADGARALLSVTAQSMITVAGVVFSITTVALTFASNQFGTRILRNFIHDVGNQVVFGTFLATFIYGLVVMRRIEGGEHGFVPSLAVAVGIFLAVASTFTLVYFIHHVIVSMEAETVVSRVAEELHDTIEVLFPDKLGKDESQTPPQQRSQELPQDFEERSFSIESPGEGFIGNIDSDELLKLATRHDLIVRICLRPGDFVFEKLTLANVWPRDRVTQKLAEQLRHTFHIKPARTYEQDLGFALQQLVLLTTRSLSPAINALGTAMDSIDRIGAALVLVGSRRIPSAYRYDKQNNLRVIARPWDLALVADEVLNPVRQAAAAQPTVIDHLLIVLGQAIPHTENQPLRQRLGEHLRRIEDAARNFPQAIDRLQAEKALSKALHKNPAA